MKILNFEFLHSSQLGHASFLAQACCSIQKETIKQESPILKKIEFWAIFQKTIKPLQNQVDGFDFYAFTQNS